MDNFDNAIIRSKRRKKIYIITLLLHITFHMSLLTLFEPIFFFNYVSKVEEKAFYGQITNYLSFLSKKEGLFKDNTISNKFILNNINDELNKEKNYNTLFEMKKNIHIGLENKKDHNKKLENKSYLFFKFLFPIFLLIGIIFVWKVNLDLPKIFLEHILTISFIGFYEMWFFNNIVMNYKTVSSEEMNFLITTCLLKMTETNYDQISFNKNITDNCFLI